MELNPEDTEKWIRTELGHQGRIHFSGDSAAVKESFRWGEPFITWQDDGHLQVSIALSLNQELTGGLELLDVEIPDGEEGATARVRDMGERLMTYLADRNLINTALMTNRRGQQRSERDRAEAIHDWKAAHRKEIREGFSRLEPELILAIRREDRSEARRLLNALLMHIYNLSQGKTERFRELVAELVVLMRHSARECGVGEDAHPMLSGPVWEAVARMEDEEELSRWIQQNLDGLMDLIGSSSLRPATLRARKVVDYIRENCTRQLRRSEVARIAGLSDGEFSRTLRRETGMTFQQHLNRFRIDQACDLLRQSELTVEEVAYRCGFESPPHFSRSFKGRTGVSPSRFRSQSP